MQNFSLSLFSFLLCFVLFLIAVCKVLFFVRIFHSFDLHLMNTIKVSLIITFQTSKVGGGEIRLCD